MHQILSTDILLCEGFRLDRLGLSRLDPGGVASPVALGSRALDLAWLLADRHGELISKDEIMETVWPGRVVEENNLTVQISTLRRILDQARAEGSCIQTVVGHGYRFVAPVTRLEPPSALLPTSVGPRPRLSLVVMPFENLGDDRQQQHLADGITDDLTTDLSRLKDMFVISRTTAFTYRNKPTRIKQISHELGVRYVLEGSVRRSGDQLRLNVQLIDADADTHLWAERFDRHVSDFFALQDEITTAIIGAIEPELLKSERDRIAGQPERNEDAYALYQRGMWHHYRQNKADNIEAQAFFCRALAIDPQYPQATAALSIALCAAAYLSWSDNAKQNYEESLEMAERSVALDPRYPNAHFALALISMWLGRNDRAAAEFNEAIKLNPSFAAAHAVLGVVLNFQGQSENGVASVEKGIRLSPSDPRLFIWLSGLAAAHYQLRHYSEAVEIGRRSWTLNRNYITGLTYVVAGLAQLGKTKDALGALADLKERDPELAALRTTLELYENQAGLDHLLHGLRKAGFQRVG
jgi:TolB-like protein/Tfp pilus assembly protein PilF